MVQVEHAERFDPDAQPYGASEWEWEKLGAFYDNGADAIDALVEANAFQVTSWPSLTERYPALVTYHPDLDMSINGFYRHLGPDKGDGSIGPGAELVRLLGEAVKVREIDLRTGRRVQGLIQDESGAAVGVRVGDTPLYARKGVVFASGGFAHNLELIRRWR